MAGNNIAALRKAKNMSQTELAGAIGTSLNMMGKLERGDRTLNQSWIDKLARVLGVEPGAILAGQPVLVAPHHSGRSVARSDHAPTRTVGAGETVGIAKLDLSLSMGPGTNIDHDYIEVETVEFDIGFLRGITPSQPAMLRLVSGIGDSMFPTLLDTDLMFLDVGQRTLNMQDRIYGISLFGAGAIKRLRAIGNKKILVISDNPAVEDQEVDAHDITNVGRIVGAIRRH
jgi:phage repressor protein C with HTH and peptisase S24 domain